MEAEDHGIQLETRRAVPADTRAAAEVLADAFTTYPWTRWTVDSRDHVDRVQALQHLALETLGIPFGQVWVTTRCSGIASVAVWMDSSVDIPASVQEDSAPAVAKLEGRRHSASLLASRQIASSRPTERHFYLAAIGTRSAHQGRGLGRRTLLPVLGVVDDEGIPAFLETSSRGNVLFYSGLGFDVVGHEVIHGGGPDVWMMFRPPDAHS